jgi:hypothetical protein
VAGLRRLHDVGMKQLAGRGGAGVKVSVQGAAFGLGRADGRARLGLRLRLRGARADEQASLTAASAQIRSGHDLCEGDTAIGHGARECGPGCHEPPGLWTHAFESWWLVRRR